MHIMKFRRLLDIIVACQVVIKCVSEQINCILDSASFIDLDIYGWVLSLKETSFSLLTIHHVHPSLIKNKLHHSTQ